jgi:hypothetical protein
MKELIDRDYINSNSVRQREYSRLWECVVEKIFGGNLLEAKSNVVRAAYEGGLRLQRRQENIETAFTYGKKIKYE